MTNPDKNATQTCFHVRLNNKRAEEWKYKTHVMCFKFAITILHLLHGWRGKSKPIVVAHVCNPNARRLRQDCHEFKAWAV